MERLQDGLRRPLFAVSFVLTDNGRRVFPHRHGELVFLMFQRVTLVTDLQVAQAEISLQTSQEDVVRRRFCRFRAEFGHSRIFDFDFVKKLQNTNVKNEI